MSDIIHLLPDSVANQIAAGEVIQRPASVIKELVENAIDAGATEIHVLVTDAGKTSIQVIDNGCGMSATHARLSFERHATSKIRTASDLFALRTMGFRGEALASIAAVAEVELKTRLAGDELGTRIVLAASKVECQEPVACPQGSNFAVKNLFFNVPARRKFLKSNATELNNILAEFERIVLVHPDIAFYLYSNDTALYNLPAVSLRQRIVSVFGKKLDQQLIALDVDTTLVRISGYVGKPDAARKKGAHQYFFVNGRYMRHPYFHKAVMEPYERLVPAGEQVPYFVYFDVDPANIDVNIHPTKTEVKFEDEQMLFQLLSASVRETLGRNSFRAGLNFETDKAVEIPQIGRFYDEYRPVEALGIEFDPDYDPFRAAEGGTAAGDSVQAGREIPSGSWSPAFAARGKAAPADGYGKLFEDRPGAVSRTLIIGGRFVVTPAASGMMVVNIRRATERILYERTLKALSGAREHVSQTTLFPVEIRLGVERRLILDEHADLLARIGFDIKPCGEDSISVEGVPEGYSSSPGDVQSAVEELTDILSQQGDALQEIMNQRLAGKIAASGAAGAEKIGTPLQAQRLIDTLFECDNAETTADGRRTVNIISTEDIDKLF